MPEKKIIARDYRGDRGPGSCQVVIGFRAGILFLSSVVRDGTFDIIFTCGAWARVDWIS